MSQKTRQLESLFCWGSWQQEIRDTFEKAWPIRNKLPRKIAQGYILHLLREQTYIAMKWRDPQQRRIEKAWIASCRALDTFLRGLSEPASDELTEDLRRRPSDAEAARTTVFNSPKIEPLRPSSELLEALRIYSEPPYSLPSYKEALEKKDGDKSDAFWSDAVALVLANHFKEKTGAPQWPTVAQLMSCAPPMKYKRKKGPGESPVSMQTEDIRRRIVRRQREKKLPVRYKPTLDEIAYEFKR